MNSSEPSSPSCDNPPLENSGVLWRWYTKLVSIPGEEVARAYYTIGIVEKVLKVIVWVVVSGVSLAALVWVTGVPISQKPSVRPLEQMTTAEQYQHFLDEYQGKIKKVGRNDTADLLNFFIAVVRDLQTIKKREPWRTQEVDEA